MFLSKTSFQTTEVFFDFGIVNLMEINYGHSSFLGEITNFRRSPAA